MAAEDVAGWESQEHYAGDDEEEEEDEEPTDEERDESVRGFRERIGGHADDGRDGRDGRGPGGGRSGDDDEKP